MKRIMIIDHSYHTYLFFCSLISWMALSFCSKLACADTMCAVWSCRVKECFLKDNAAERSQTSHDGTTFESKRRILVGGRRDVSVNVLELGGSRELDEFVCPIASRDKRGRLLVRRRCRRCSLWGNCAWARREGPHQRGMSIVRGCSRRKLLIH